MNLSEAIQAACNGKLVSWRDEVRYCQRHGQYRARIIFLGDKKVSGGFCPECHRIYEETEAKRHEEERARLEAEKERKRIEQAIGRACIPADFKDKSFDTFVADTPELKSALELSKRFVAGWEKAKAGGYGLFFYGNPGTGKSHLATSILKTLVKGATGLYTRVPDMVGYIRSSWRPNCATSAYDAIREFVNVDLLVLDELGVQSGSQNEQTLLFEVIDARLSENKPTIFISNFAPQDLVNIVGVRIVDRIKGKCVLQRFSGESRRKPLTADVFVG